MSQFPNALKPSEEDIAKMLACQVHLGSRNSNTAMETYIYKRRNDGIHIFDLNKTWAKVSAFVFSACLSDPLPRSCRWLRA
jgi:small subunit ribosomal protein SAe